MESTVQIKEPISKPGSRGKYPDSMTKEAVSEMYLSKNMTRGQIADYYGTTIITVNNFISRNELRRKDRKDSKPKRMTGTVTKLSKSELRSHGKDPDHEYCPICDKSIYFSYSMNRIDYAYKFKTCKGKMVYCCGWNHLQQARAMDKPSAVFNEY